MKLEKVTGSEIQIHNIDSIEQALPALFEWALPIMALLTIAEFIVSYKHQHGHYEKKETIGTIAVGIGNALISIYAKVLLIYLLILIYNFLPWRLQLEWWMFLPCFILLDFCNYWAHRISHRQRIWWATHVVHHSSENFNLTVSFRLSWLESFKIIFLLPVALCGFHPVIIFIANQVVSIYQFFVHTEYIPKLHPLIEYIFVTPSSHRVHHGSQEKYINKNYGATLIIWDRIFGTYQEEEERPVFGITTNITSKTNPFSINFHEFNAMIKDIRLAKGIRQKLFCVFGDPIDIHKMQHKMIGNKKADPV
jgi:sterol desaturase/sphingolipid hydroxylase (fatty acid hydroxylase superfamily)